MTTNSVLLKDVWNSFKVKFANLKYFKNIFLQDISAEIFLVNIAFIKDYVYCGGLIIPEQIMPYIPFLRVDIIGTGT